MRQVVQVVGTDVGVMCMGSDQVVVRPNAAYPLCASCAEFAGSLLHSSKA